MAFNLKVNTSLPCIRAVLTRHYRSFNLKVNTKLCKYKAVDKVEDRLVYEQPI